ncbi:MAG: carbamoyl-phosphate synthase large subunit [Oscillospiraceae bacterium]|jgi:carbamoyl-phosphate synthase large subunit|nr:carbamoyl-phosphate synthase large subunit [Oscillospiraceae bacterium]
MPKRTDIKKILVIGSGPIVIGQAAEFDYSGTQGCLALKKLGYEICLVNSNPATIMTDKSVANIVYMEPLNLEYVAKIIRKERPDAILPTLGGQTALNLALALEQKGILEECECELLGTTAKSINLAENREKFKALCKKISEPSIESGVATSDEEAFKLAKKIGYPVVVRPAFTLGGTGGGFANNKEELASLISRALDASKMRQALIEKSMNGYKEIEYEVIRDSNDTALTVCNMENLDPVGIHTGDSIVICPSQTLTNKDFHMLRNASLKIIRELKIQGGCNIQFALDPFSNNYYVIEVNPRVSRSSALASKASGYPIAKVSALISVGMTLDEIKLANTPACFEPTLDYIVTKIPRFPFDKFEGASRVLGTQMKSTGEAMAIGRTFEESLLKAIRSLELGLSHLWSLKLSLNSRKELIKKIKVQTDERLLIIAELLRREEKVEIISELTGIDKFFIDKIKNIVDFEKILKKDPFNLKTFRIAKRLGFSDDFIGQLWEVNYKQIYEFRARNKIRPVYKMIDTCASEFKSYVPYFYSCYEEENESKLTDNEKIVILGSGPIRVGQGIEFDYSTVHAVLAIQEAGFEAIVVNNNPSTVSTDYFVSNKLYFEPLTVENVMDIIDFEKPKGVLITLGGQTSINVGIKIKALGAPIIGTSTESIKKTEDRKKFEECLKSIKIPQPDGKTVKHVEEGKKVANRLGYPCLIRPSFVLGGRAMRIVRNDEELVNYLESAFLVSKNKPILVDKYIEGKELDVDAVCDSKNVFIPGIMQHVEKTGVHSGDSISVYPTFSISQKMKKKVLEYVVKLGLELGIIGPYNVQFIIDKNEKIFAIEVNPRVSRTVPFISKATNINLANIATKVSIGKSLFEQKIFGGMLKEKKAWYVKTPVFSFSKILGLDAFLSPEMKSTGEAIGYDKSLNRALYKSLKASSMKVKNYGTVFVTVADEDKQKALPLVKRFYNLGFNIESTRGTSLFLKSRGIRTRYKKKISEGSDEILESIRKQHITYIINTLTNISKSTKDGYMIRRTAVENNVNVFTSLDTVNVLLNVLEEITIGVQTVDKLE